MRIRSGSRVRQISVANKGDGVTELQEEMDVLERLYVKTISRKDLVLFIYVALTWHRSKPHAPSAPLVLLWT